MNTITTKYKKEFVNWLNNEAEMQKLGLSDLFEWQWFITMTSKDTMTKNGARLAMTRFLGLYLYESKTEDVQCLWVTEPHNQGKNGYHIHALLQTRWPVPQERRRELQLALMLDDIYQRAMGLSPVHGYNGTEYLGRDGKNTNKHRFRAEPYSKARGAYCVKYITKEPDMLWEFAHVRINEIKSTQPDFLGELDGEHLKDAKGNWDKKWARMRTQAIKRANELRSGENIVRLNQLNGRAHLNWAKFAKMRASENELELEHYFKPRKGVLVF